ncbi:DEAD/DEAH box helicase [Brachybacterium sp. AOP25-B2-12]|uniref:DEAD/DEAH box helicase n=1 Tax=Brachybacterium sp. AOP25-B2-12 TaxID=3457710 RepID=UPI00403379B7
MSRSRRSADPGWRDLLDGLSAAGPGPGAGDLPLAIGVDLLTGFGGFGFSRFGASPADVQDVRDGSPLAVALRPLRPGAADGSWVRGSLTWKRFRYAGASASSSGGLEAYRPGHAELLGRLVRLHLAEHPFGTDPGDVLRLDEFRGPDAWTLLDLARRSGVQLVGTGAVGGVTLTAPARVSVELRRAGGGLDVAPSIEIDGEDAPRRGLSPSGTGGFFAVEPGPGSRTVHVDLVPLAQALPPSIAGLLTRAEPLRVPGAEVEDFLTDLAPQLRARIPVRSSDPAITVHEHVPPRLVCEVAYGTGDDLVLRWSWEYRAPRRTLPLARPSRAPDRDAAHEEDVLARVGAIRAGLADTERQELTGVEAAEFVEEALPQLLALEAVTVREDGDRPAYTEVTGTPHLRITQVEPPNGHAQDWMGLGFMITLGGQLVPFTAVFRALTSRQRSVMLPDRSYARLDHPMFARLRELIAEAEAMEEWEPGSPAVNRRAIELWADFEYLADETVEAVSWRESVGRLRDLTDVPVPPLPAGLDARLRPYQAEGYAWLDLLRTHGLGGILADDMGLGKTLQTLTAIARAREVDPAAPPFLVVAPSSVLQVWRAEAERFTPHLDVRLVDSTSATRGAALAETTRGADIVVTSYTLLRLDADEHIDASYAGLILDEAQFVKNPASRAHEVATLVRAPFRLAITGTPMENSLEDLWALLAITAPGLYASRRAFREQYVRPIEKPDPSESGRRRAEDRLALLRRRIRPFILRRTKDVVARDLPDRQEQVIRVPLRPAHRRLYERILQRERQKLLGLVEDIDRHRFIVFRSLTLLRMLALDPAIVDPEYEGVVSSKLEDTLERLDEVIAEHHRVLVFSQFTSHLERVAARLADRGIAYAYLDGSTTHRERVVRAFREGEAPVFLISLKAGGFGLTLTEADYVFLLDPWWNPAAEAQAVDRTHRIGQERRVMVYRMVAAGTIEEKVLELQERKRALFSALTDDGTAFAGAVTAEDVRMLLGG